MKKLSLFSRIVFVLNVFFALTLLFIGFTSYSQENSFPPLLLLSLFVPLLFVVNLFFCLYWFIRRKKHFWLSFVTILIGYFVFGVFYMATKQKKEIDFNNSLNIISYNSRGFNIYENIKRKDVGDQIVRFISSENPDIVCFQEVNYAYLKHFDSYPYRYRSVKSGSGKSKLAILSKYPIISNATISFPNSSNDAVYADIVFKKDTIRIYNVHLQSYKIVPSSQTLTEGQSERTYRKLRNTFDKQLEQAKIFREHLKKSPFKTIISGDFNNTQFSNIYRMVKGDFQDSFLEAGQGFGRTYDLKGLPMRIDYILADDSFEILEHQNYDVKLSDHYPIKATLGIK
ncbi:endonuclease/exonuclease/phosphatase family protein [Croceitalea marina]|uniref:Endonuclease/exonuclease/phosphatase family protein n=1 Tax=Croceitalea marina TaxID=1775166 RepID=A0ABW5N152_9FLAO